MISSVFLLLHIHHFEDGAESEKLLGVFSSRESARRHREVAASLPGFSEAQDGFTIDEYIVDKPDWVDGYVTVANDDSEP